MSLENPSADDGNRKDSPNKDNSSELDGEIFPSSAIDKSTIAHQIKLQNLKLLRETDTTKFLQACLNIVQNYNDRPYQPLYSYLHSSVTYDLEKQKDSLKPEDICAAHVVLAKLAQDSNNLPLAQDYCSKVCSMENIPITSKLFFYVLPLTFYQGTKRFAETDKYIENIHLLTSPDYNEIEVKSLFNTYTTINSVLLSQNRSQRAAFIADRFIEGLENTGLEHSPGTANLRYTLASLLFDIEISSNPLKAHAHKSEEIITKLIKDIDKYNLDESQKDETLIDCKLFLVRIYSERENDTLALQEAENGYKICKKALAKITILGEHQTELEITALDGFLLYAETLIEQDQMEQAHSIAWEGFNYLSDNMLQSHLFQAGFTSVLGQAKLKEASQYNDFELFEEAEKDFEKSIQLLEELGGDSDSIEIGKCYSLLADTLLEKCEHINFYGDKAQILKKSIALIHKALNQYNQLPNTYPERICYTYEQLSEVYSLVGDMDNSNKYRDLAIYNKSVIGLE